jgi:hypothetical protein
MRTFGNADLAMSALGPSAWWVQCVVRSDVDVAEHLMCARVPGRNQDRVVLGRVQLAECGDREPAVGDDPALFELQPTDADKVVVPVEFV